MKIASDYTEVAMIHQDNIRGAPNTVSWWHEVVRGVDVSHLSIKLTIIWPPSLFDLVFAAVALTTSLIRSDYRPGIENTAIRHMILRSSVLTFTDIP